MTPNDNADARAPYVRFEKRAEKDAEASIEKGSNVYKDVEYALITPPGSKDCVERVAKEWFEYLETQVQGNRFPETWLRMFRSRYDAWQKTGEVPIEGTSILNWPLITPSEAKALQDLFILSVEDLAGANEQAVQSIGMGGRNLKEKAKQFLRAQGDGGGKVAEEMVALKQKLDDQATALAESTRQIAMLKSQLQSNDSDIPHQVQGNRDEVIAASELLDDNASSTHTAPSGNIKAARKL